MRLRIIKKEYEKECYNCGDLFVTKDKKEIFCSENCKEYIKLMLRIENKKGH